MHSELVLAQFAQQEDISEVESLLNSSLQSVTDPEIIVKEKWEKKLSEFQCGMEEKLNLCRIMLSKESLEKNFIRLAEILKKFQLEYSCFRKEFLSR